MLNGRYEGEYIIYVKQHEPLAGYVKLRVAHAPEYRERFPPICDPSTSGGFGRLMTFYLAESPILPGRDVLCTTAIDYNYYVSKGKTIVNSLCQLYHQNPPDFIYLYMWLLKSSKISKKINISQYK